MADHRKRREDVRDRLLLLRAEGEGSLFHTNAAGMVGL